MGLLATGVAVTAGWGPTFAARAAGIEGVPVGLFPAGDQQRVVASAYQSPGEVVADYVVDRLTFVEADRPGARAVIEPEQLIDASHAIVGVTVYDEADWVRDGNVLVERLTSDDGSGWVVTAASFGSINLTGLSYDGRHIVGVMESSQVGTFHVAVHDPATNDVILSTQFASTMGTNEFGAADPDPVALDIAEVEATAVALRVVRHDDPDDPADWFEYAEVLVRVGEPDVDGGMLVLHEASLAVDGPAFSTGLYDYDAFNTLDVDSVLVAEDGLRIQRWVNPDADSLCLAITYGPATYRPCFDSFPLAFQRSPASDDFLVIGIVPDAVTSVTDPTGRQIPIANNVWYDVLESVPSRYLYSNADGSVIDVVHAAHSRGPVGTVVGWP